MTATSSFRCVVAVLLLIGATASLSAAPLLPPSKEQINQWITQLGDRSFATRQRAQDNLWQAGELAETILREAVANTTDPEVKKRGTEILEKFKWGLYPNTPRKIADLIRQYQSGSPNVRQQLVKRFLDEGGPGCKTLIKIAKVEDNPNLRRQLYATITTEAGRALPDLLGRNDFATLDALLDLCLAQEYRTSLRHWIAYQLLRGKLDDQIKNYQEKVAKEPEKQQLRETLFYLHRAKGDLKAAREVARQANLPTLLADLALDQGDWKEAARLFQGEDLLPMEKIGYQAAVNRLAGKSKEAEAFLAEIRKRGEATNPNSEERWYAAKALFINERPNEAMALLDHRPEIKAEILIAHMKFTEALKVLDADRIPRELQGINANTASRELLTARVHFLLGDREKMASLLDGLAERIKPGVDQSWAGQLIETELRLNRTEKAFEHAARALPLLQHPYSQTQILEKLFPDHGEAARAWWLVFRARQPQGDVLDAMKQLRELFAGKIKGNTLAMLCQDAPTRVPELAQGSGPLQLAEVAVLAGEDTLAESFFKKATEAPTPVPALRYGDWLGSKKRWKEAAEIYALAYDKERKAPLPLYLQGWALLQAGQKKEGQRLIDQAHWLPLGDDRLRSYFASDLARRDHLEDARKERALLMRTCPLRSYYAGEAQRQNSLEANARGDYLEVARGHEQAILRCLHPTVSFLDPSAFIGVPHYIHRQRARGLVAAGKVDEAKAEIERCLTLLPAQVDLAINLVPALEKAGDKKAADDLFQRVLTVKEQLCKEQPRSATLHNSLAWMCACCRRGLETGLTHARRATELEPTASGYRDTLAEIYFQKGDKEKAIAAMTKCLEQEPKRSYYQKQLARFRAGDPGAPLPPE